MTPKEKAKELVNKLKLSFAGVISNDEDWESLAKQCALISVDELIFYCSNLEMYYWQQVKQEIEKL
jgi:hypothetical protein